MAHSNLKAADMERVKRRALLLMLRARALFQALKLWCRSRQLLASIIAMGLVLIGTVVSLRSSSRALESKRVLDDGLSTQSAHSGPNGLSVHRPPSGAQARRCIREMGAIHACVNQRLPNCTAAAYWRCLREHGFADGQYTALVRSRLRPRSSPAPPLTALAKRGSATK